MSDGLGHDNRVPSGDEITMETTSVIITVGPYERLAGTISVGKLIDRVKVLEEDAGNSDWVGGGAISSVRAVTVVDGVRHVVLVVGRIEIDTVPAHREPYLSTESITAEIIFSLESVGLRSIGPTGDQTDVRDSARFGRVVTRSLQSVTSQHSETFRDGLPVRVGLVGASVTTSGEVVDGQTRVGNQRQGTVRPLVEEIGGPVVRVVDGVERA